MLTRLKRPSLAKRLMITLLLVGFQAYLGFSAVSGQYGIESRKALRAEISNLTETSIRLSAEISSYRHRIALFDTERLDPDILTERARAMLSMGRADERVIIPPASQL